MIERLRASNNWKFAGVIGQADGRLAAAWWSLLLLRGLLPALFAVTMGGLVGAVQQHGDLAAPLALAGIVFVLLQVLPPIHHATGANLGSRIAASLYDQLAQACVRPPGMGHLENPKLTTDLTMARDFDLGITGPPMSMSMDFIAGGLVEMVGGLASAAVLAAYAWWAPLVLVGAWFGTHWLLRESGVWKDRNTQEVREAQRHADYTYRLAVEPLAAKELRLFGLADWVIERFRSRRQRLFELRWEATRLRERPLIWSLLLALGANVAVFWSMGAAASAGSLPLGRLAMFASAAMSTSMIAFGGLSWALDGAAAPAAAVLRLRQAMGPAGALPEGHRPVVTTSGKMPAREIRFRNVTFQYPAAAGEPELGGVAPVLAGFDLTIPAGTSLAIVGQNGAGKTTLAKLLCRLYDPQEGAIEVDGVNLRELDLDGWRARVTAVFQDFIRFELPLRDNVAPGGAPDQAIESALAEAGASNLAKLDTVLARGYPDGTDLSGGQWQRVALARALCAVRLGAGVVLLDEPTAQLDVRGESEIFDRILTATRHTTTILISHRFSTVRHADRICVLEHGRVVELGTHEALMAAGGRYRTMFELQASRFGEEEEAAHAQLDSLD
ncbi:MAG TPA: ABC transporter ATP-binding protein [Candidatus Acidoferrales bacterium]|nr:ABC transporter ATP-binding protein [Candidatus Acidoferrales bacterium]